MSKYIDADKLIAEIERLAETLPEARSTMEGLLSLIDSLQQEQTPTEREIAEAHRYAEMIRERDRARIQQEQPEANLEKIIGQTYHDGSVADTSDMDHVDYENIARHFYELGLNARKEE